GFGKVLRWISLLDGLPGFYFRTLSAYLYAQWLPVVLCLPVSFLTHYIFPNSLSPLATLKWLFTDFLSGFLLRSLVDVLLCELFPAYKLGWIGWGVFQGSLYVRY